MNRQQYKGTRRYVFLEIFDILNDVILQNSCEFLLLKTPQETKTCSKSTIKSTSAASVNFVRVPFLLAWNIISKRVTEFLFLIKLQAFTKNGKEGVCHGLCDRICFKLWAVGESVFRNAVNKEVLYKKE